MLQTADWLEPVLRAALHLPAELVLLVLELPARRLMPLPSKGLSTMNSMSVEAVHSPWLLELREMAERLAVG